MIACITSAWESPVKGRFSASISYNTTPNEKMSLRASTGLPFRLLRRHVSNGSDDYSPTVRTSVNVRVASSDVARS